MVNSKKITSGIAALVIAGIILFFGIIVVMNGGRMGWVAIVLAGIAIVTGIIDVLRVVRS